MTDDVKERCAAETAAIAAARKYIYIGDDADGDPVLIGLEDGIRAALSALRPGDEIGECVLVPKEPTTGMANAGMIASSCRVPVEPVYRAMLAAAKKKG